MALITLEDSNQNKLALVNRCLQAIGEAPLPQGTIPSEFPLGSDTQVASSIVDDIWIKVQNKGWWFNTDTNFTLTPDQQGLISLPATVLRIDGGRYQTLIKRNGMLYDRVLQTFQFTAPVSVDVIWAVSYSSLPVAAYEYIAAAASLKFYRSVIGATEHTAELEREVTEALVDLQRENAQYLDQSLIEGQVSFRFRNPLKEY